MSAPARSRLLPLERSRVSAPASRLLPLEQEQGACSRFVCSSLRSAPACAPLERKGAFKAGADAMTNPCEPSGDGCFRYAPVLTLSDSRESMKIAHALTESGINTYAVGGDVIVAWDDLATADNAVIELSASVPILTGPKCR